MRLEVLSRRGDQSNGEDEERASRAGQSSPLPDTLSRRCSVVGWGQHFSVIASGEGWGRDGELEARSRLTLPAVPPTVSTTACPASFGEPRMPVERGARF